jgi:hypothetical protein
MGWLDEAAAGQSRVVTVTGEMGTGTATFQATVHADAEQTRVTIHSKVDLTGRPAELSRHLVSDTGARFFAKFAKALAVELGGPGEPGEPAKVLVGPEPVVVEPEPAVEEVAPALEPEAALPSHEDFDDLESYELSSGPSVFKRTAPVVAVLLAILAVRLLFRRRRGRHHG